MENTERHLNIYIYFGFKCAHCTDSVHRPGICGRNGTDDMETNSCVVFVLIFFSALCLCNDFIYDKHIINNCLHDDVNLVFFSSFSCRIGKRNETDTQTYNINRLHGKWLSDKKCIMFSSCRIVSMRNGILSIVCTVQSVCCITV